MPDCLWIDVEDLFRYFEHNNRPSGIQRLQFELCRALAEGDTANVRFVRHAASGASLHTVPYSALRTRFEVMASRDLEPKPGRSIGPSAPTAPPSGAYRISRALVRRLPDRIRLPLADFYVRQRAAWRGLADAASGKGGRRGQPGGAVKPSSVAPAKDRRAGSASDEFSREARPGDAILVLGSPWFEGHAGLVGKVRRERGLRLVLLVYDIVPLRHPEWCDPTLVRQFTAWIAEILPLADVLLTISRATAGELERFAAKSGIALLAPPVPIPLGTGFTTGVAPAMTANGGASRELPQPGTYVLLVATIEARKNHALLFRVWRRLLDELDVSQVPTLVFAGKVGWLVEDLMAQLDNCAFLDGKILVVEEPSDTELRALYAGCLFTVFPSFYEGWGLPVTESLAQGCPCVISSAMSLPEAGGALARYFDPENAREAYAVIKDCIVDVDGLGAWRARIARDFEPVGWDRSARAVLAAIGRDG